MCTGVYYYSWSEAAVLTAQAFGSIMKELEASRMALLSSWMGSDVTDLMAKAGALFESLGGYPLPKPKM